MNIKKKLQTLPSSPGVYLMKNENKEIIYVGKSKNLKNRVPTYFRTPDPEDKKANKLFRSISDFELLLTDTELEALLLESKLIKKYKPWCNRLMKNPEAYTYIKITMDEEIPDIFITHEKDPQDTALYFGPYPKKGSLENSVNTLRDIYKIKCTKYNRKASACLNYSLGLCNGVCIGEISKEDYRTHILEIIDLLSGNNQDLFRNLQHDMDQYVEDFEFEKAAKTRDQINSLTIFLTYANMINFIQLDSPFIVIEKINSDSHKVLLFLGNQVIWKYILSSNCTLEENTIKIVESILNQTSINTSAEITKFEVDEMYILYSYLKNKSNDCRYLILDNAVSKDILFTEIKNFLVDSQGIVM